ncbi:helix-turn-helix transcriptional regulator [Campylobacter sp. MIT 19-121]|uniref:helix-turn-helix domain-containing protein n=1 Tax=Campylobacter sp. MIT 19-121 TaxID=2703906 RepID=UPI00138A2EE3|nr:AraC family transcriptional regulator [Campylobacter sp. MIT 19-121]NDJ27162.1 helix-turn-helix transcriptional regulator [Campylobacter sp. MIT 19-121]
MFYLPKELKSIQDKKQSTELKSVSSCVFARYKQNDSSHKLFTCMQENVLIFVKEGEKKVHFQDEFDEKELILKENQALLLPAGAYLLSNIAKQNYEAYLFFFNNTLLAKLGFKHKDLFFAQMQNANSVHLAQNTPLEDESLSQIVSAFAPYFEPNSAHLDPLIELKFEELFLHLALSKNSLFLSFLKTIFNTSRLRLDQLFAYCESEFLSVADMAEFAGLDNASFSREFKQYFKISPKKWLDEKRLLKAKFLLQYADKNVNEICTDCGFSSPAWFIARFKEQFNQTPKQYQKTLQKASF